MFKNKPRLTLDKSSPNGSSSSPLPSQAMLPTVTTTSQAITLADSEYAQKRREIYKLLKKLSDLVGASSEIRIPQIAVVGSQSAGKSSLVEAITGISVPRDSGTCTKCPMRCTVSTEGNEWSCTISVQDEPSGIGSISAARPFSPKLTSKGDVELWIRRAQTALLSPHAPLDSFKNRSANELKEVVDNDPAIRPFSNGRVLIHICDPKGTELAFIDLPGLIQNFGGDNPKVVIDTVRSLVEDNIKDKETVILVTVPATDDIQTVQAFSLAREADPDGERTIAVVTKPDLLSDGSTGLRDGWLDILQGRKEPLRLGYYAVRLPDDEQRRRGLSRSQVDVEARDFFSSKHPWKNTSPDRLGIPHLVSDISKLLMKIIQDSIPKLKQDATARLDAVTREIANLPPRGSTDAVAEVSLRTSKFCKELHDYVYGRNAGKRSFVHSTRDAHKQFKRAVHSTMPDFRPFTQGAEYRRPDNPSSVAESGDGGVRSTSIRLTGLPMDLLFVRKVIKDYTGWELPGHIPSEAKDHLISLSVNQWLPPALQCFHESEAVLHEYVDMNIGMHFGQFKALERHMRAIITSQLDAHQRVVLKALHDVVAREGPPYYTENDHYYEANYTKWLWHYCYVNENAHRYKIVTDSMVDGVSAHVAPQVYSGPPSPTMLAVPAHEPPRSASRYDDEMKVMASVRAYVQVAYKRIVDHVPRTIQRDLSQVFVDDLEGRLLGALKLGEANASQRLQDLLLEDPQVAAKRKRLADTKRVLEEVILTLNTFVV